MYTFPNSKTIVNLGPNWQQTRLDFDYETNHLCPPLAIDLSIKPANKLYQQIDVRNRAEFASDSALNLPSGYARLRSFSVTNLLAKHV